MSGPLVTARRAVRAAAAVGWTAALMPVSATSTKLAGAERAETHFDGWVRRWAAGMLHISGIRIVLAGPPPRRPTGARLVVSNHRTAADIPLLLSLFGGSCLSRSDLADWPVLGAAAKQAHTIFVDRDDRYSGVKAVRAIRSQLQAGRTVSVFPEGETFAGDEVRPFQAGALAAARRLDVEIVPVGIAVPEGIEYTGDSFLEHAATLAGSRRLHYGVCVGPGVSVDRLRKPLTDNLRSEVQKLVNRARAAVDAHAARERR